jgi:hypothetical protein
MDYRAVLTLDHNAPFDGNALYRLYNGLEQAGWSYAETSAMYIECDDLGPVLMGLELLARGLGAVGELSAMNLQVQLVGPPRRPPAANNHRRALDNLLGQPLPSEM